MDNKNVIPPITDPLGRYWDQPPRDRIAIDDTHALMDTAAFDALAEYSATIPTGVYPGKMWKARAAGGWRLRWFGIAEDPKLCTNNQREILLA